MKKIIYVLVLLAIVVSGAYFFKSPAETDTDTVVDDKSDLIVVEVPIFDATISSPLTVSGKARGSWYFEATFPMLLVGLDGTVIAQGNATARENWMTEEFVPFEGTLTFSAPLGGTLLFTVPKTGENGWLVLQKNNPSGLPENDDSVVIPVQFN